MKVLAILSALMLSLVFASVATAGYGHHSHKVTICLGDHTVSVDKHAVQSVLAAHPGSYLGECAATPPPVPTPSPFPAQVDRGGACAATDVLRADGTMGRFLDLPEAQLQLGTFNGVAIVPAFFVSGLGLTCDIPPGYHYAGYKVADTNGVVDLAAPQFNIYPLYVTS